MDAPVDEAASLIFSTESASKSTQYDFNLIRICCDFAGVATATTAGRNDFAATMRGLLACIRGVPRAKVDICVCISYYYSEIELHRGVANSNAFFPVVYSWIKMSFRGFSLSEFWLRSIALCSEILRMRA